MIRRSRQIRRCVDAYPLRRERSQNFDNNTAYPNFWASTGFKNIFSISGGSSDGMSAATLPVNTKKCSLMIASVAWGLSSLFATFGDTAGNTWSQAVAINNNSVELDLYYVINPITNGSDIFSVVGSGTSTFPAVTVEGFSGPMCQIDQMSSMTTNLAVGTTILQPGSIVPSTKNSLIVTAIGTRMDTFGTGSLSLDSGFNLQSITTNPNSLANGQGWLIQAGVSAINPKWTIIPQLFSLSCATIVSFKPI